MGGQRVQPDGPHSLHCQHREPHLPQTQKIQQLHPLHRRGPTDLQLWILGNKSPGNGGHAQAGSRRRPCSMGGGHCQDLLGFSFILKAQVPLVRCSPPNIAAVQPQLKSDRLRKAAKNSFWQEGEGAALQMQPQAFHTRWHQPALQRSCSVEPLEGRWPSWKSVLQKALLTPHTWLSLLSSPSSSRNSPALTWQHY